MCIIISLPVGSSVKNSVLSHAWKSNPDGAGYMFVENIDTSPVVKVVKGFFKYNSFLSSFEQHRIENPNSNFVIHFRYATHGSIKKNNCHPFWVVENELCMTHNGTINVPREGDITDSQVVANLIGTLYKDNITIEVPAIQTLLTAFVGTSKLVFLDKNNKVTIINEKLGDVVDGVWYSNTYYKTTRVTPVSTSVYTKGYESNVYTVDKCKTDGCMNSLFLPIERTMEYCIKCLNGCKSKGCVCCGAALQTQTEKRNYTCTKCLIDIGSYV
jgi:predicted glutamine amidotransferase